jgi:RNA polymerase sigma factor (sigma-70 family)
MTESNDILGNFDPGATTSMHAHRAREGDPDSKEWLAKRLTPFVRAFAVSKMSPTLRNRLGNVDEIVNQSWSVFLEKLPRLKSKDDRALTRRFLGFLCHAAQNVIRRHLEKFIKAAHGRQSPDEIDSRDALREHQADAITAMVRRERQDFVEIEINRLDPMFRVPLMMRVGDGMSYVTIAAALGVSVDVVHQRYHRAVSMLRKRLPQSLFDDLAWEIEGAA